MRFCPISAAIFKVTAKTSSLGALASKMRRRRVDRKCLLGVPNAVAEGRWGPCLEWLRTSTQELLKISAYVAGSRSLMCAYR